MKPHALGYLRADRSAPHQQWDEIQIRSLAARYGYNLRKTIVFTARTADPIGQLIVALDHAGADAVFIPNVTHLDGAIPAKLVAIADVIAVQAEETYARWSTGELPYLGRQLRFDSVWGTSAKGFPL